MQRSLAAVIRPETHDDADAIRVVVADAFDGRHEEPALVDAIRDHGRSIISLVALVDRRIVGHVLATRITLVPDMRLRCLGIGPLAVGKRWQGEGIGSALMGEAIAAARAIATDALFLLGDPAYYARFGFRSTSIRNEYGASDAFMALVLAEGCLDGIGALATYVPEFRDSGA
jgi:putative acetyltransferase